MEKHGIRNISGLKRRKVLKNQLQVSVVGQCPACGGNVVSEPTSFSCSEYGNSCTFRIRRNRFGSYGRGPLATEEMKLLLQGKIVEFDGLASRTGQMMTKWGDIVQRKNGRWTVRLTTGRPIVRT